MSQMRRDRIVTKVTPRVPVVKSFGKPVGEYCGATIPLN